MAQKTVEAQEPAENHDEIYDSPEIDSKYRLILLAAQRSKQLQRGAASRAEIDTRKHKATRVALKEIQSGKIHYRMLEMDGKDEGVPTKKR